MENNFNLKKFLVENKLTTNSRVLNEGIDFSPELKAEVKKSLDVWTPDQLDETSDHFIEEMDEVFSAAGFETVEGTITPRTDRAVVKVSTQYHEGTLSLDEAVQALYEIVTNPSYYDYVK